MKEKHLILFVLLMFVATIIDKCVITFIRLWEIVKEIIKSIKTKLANKDINYLQKVFLKYSCIGFVISCSVILVYWLSVQIFAPTQSSLIRQHEIIHSAEKDKDNKLPKYPKPVVAHKADHSYNSKRFICSFKLTRDIEDIRSDNYGTGTSRLIKISSHPGGKMMDKDDLLSTISAVFQRFPNIKTSPELINLVYETFITETDLGRENVEAAIKRYNNYGCAQFRIDTAKELINWLSIVRPDVHKALMDLYNKKMSFNWNLSYNVPFNIALCVQYYWQRIPDIYANINTVEDRAKCWKSAYNTYLGDGTVNAYLRRVKRMHKLQKSLAEKRKNNSDEVYASN